MADDELTREVALFIECIGVSCVLSASLLLELERCRRLRGWDRLSISAPSGG
jgi:hypothetical protein